MGVCCSKGGQNDINARSGGRGKTDSQSPNKTSKSHKPKDKSDGSKNGRSEGTQKSDKSKTDVKGKDSGGKKKDDSSEKSKNRGTSRHSTKDTSRDKESPVRKGTDSEKKPSNRDNSSGKKKENVQDSEPKSRLEEIEKRRLEKEKRKQKILENRTKAKPPQKSTPIFVNNDDERPITQAKNISTKGWWEESADDSEQVTTLDTTEADKDSNKGEIERKRPFSGTDSVAPETNKELENETTGNFKTDHSADNGSSERTFSPRTARPIRNQIPGKELDIEDYADGDGNTSLPRDVPNKTTDDIFQENISQATRAVTPKPKFKRPAPLKRGVRPLGPKRPGLPKPTIATVTTLLKKIIDLSEDKFNEHLKCQSELNDMLQKYPELFKECDPLVVVDAVRSIVANAYSGRSSVAKSSILCLGNVFSALGNIINPVLPDLITVCIKKGVSGAPEFLSTAANSTLAKVCKTGGEGRVSSSLLAVLRQNKSYQLVVLTCLVLLLNRVGDSIAKLKTLPDILEAASNGLGAGNLSIRTTSKIVLGIISEHCNIEDLINRSQLPITTKVNAKQGVKRYNPEEKDALIEKLTADVV